MKTEKKSIKPLFKYIGGKTWLKNELNCELEKVLDNNEEVTTYCEPFAGGLGAFLGVYETLLKYKVKNVILSDVNEGLINLYAHICNQKDALIQEVIAIETGFSEKVPLNIKNVKEKESIKKELVDAEEFFKKVRKEFNNHKGENSISQSARLIFLQKHSFNGVYRENGKGEYNTPFNWSGNSMLETVAPKINELYEVFHLFNIQFMVSSYEKIEYNSNTVYYLDPPYINESIMENKYHQEKFGLKEQLDLLSKIKNVNYVYSNHYSEELIAELKKDVKNNIQEIARKNIMSASAESRKFDKVEILVTKRC